MQLEFIIFKNSYRCGFVLNWFVFRIKYEVKLSNKCCVVMSWLLRIFQKQFKQIFVSLFLFLLLLQVVMKLVVRHLP